MKKERHYKVVRNKLEVPRVMMEGTDSEYKILYENKAKSVKSIPKCTKNRKRTPGPMKKTSRRPKNKVRTGKAKASKGKLNNNKMLNSNLQMNNNYANNNNKQKGGSKKSKSKARKSGLKRSMKRSRK